MNEQSKCPIMSAHTIAGGRSNKDWWPNQLNLKILHQHSSKCDPMDEGFDYAEEFKKLDLKALKKDLVCFDDGLAGLVASRLRSLRRVVRPYDLAQRRNLPDTRWPWRWRHWQPAALRR